MRRLSAFLGLYPRTWVGVRVLVLRRGVMRRFRITLRLGIHWRPGVHFRAWRWRRRVLLMTRVGRRGVDMSAASRSVGAITRGLRAAESYAPIGLRALAWVQIAYCLARGRPRAWPRAGR